MKRHDVLWLCSVAAAALVPAVASAQTAPPVDEVEEILVTARKQSEPLQRVPVVVTVIGGEALKTNLASDLSKVAELAPQVRITQGGTGTGAIISIRGVSSSSSNAGMDQSVSLEYDGVPLSRGRVLAATMYDIASIQILEGPQALFFGKNSPAGVISIQTADPGNEFEARLTAGYEFESHEKYVEGAISSPLTDTLGARVAFRASGMRGWMHNVAEPVPNRLDPSVMMPGAVQGDWGPKSENYSGRVTLKWNPSDDFEAKLKFTYDQKTANSGLGNTEGFCINPDAIPVTAGTIPIPNGDCKKNRVTSHGASNAKYWVNIPYSNNGVPNLKSNFILGSLNLVKDFTGFTVTSTTGLYQQTVKSMNTTDWSPFATSGAGQREDYDLFTQELRASTELSGPVNFMVGGYYEHFSRPFTNSPNLGNVYNPVANNYATNIMHAENKGDYLSGFVQANVELGYNVELSGGVRYSSDKKTTEVQNLSAGPAMPALLQPGTVLKGKYSDNHLSPEVTLSWHPQEDSTIYVAYKTGYKGGGLSNPFLPTKADTPENIIFRPEEVAGFEAGVKGYAFDRRLRFDLAAYRYKYNDLQVVAYDAVQILYTLQNAASSRVEGVQGSADFRVTDELTLRGNFGYNKARYLDFAGSPCFQGQTAAQGCVKGVQDLSGKPLVSAPVFVYSFGANYDTDISDTLGLGLSASASHTSSYNTATDAAPGGIQEAYWLVNAAVRLKIQEDRFEVALIGRNLTDTYYMVTSTGWSGSGNPNQYVGYFNRPREVALQGTIRF